MISLIREIGNAGEVNVKKQSLLTEASGANGHFHEAHKKGWPFDGDDRKKHFRL